MFEKTKINEKVADKKVIVLLRYVCKASPILRKVTYFPNWSTDFIGITNRLIRWIKFQLLILRLPSTSTMWSKLVLVMLTFHCYSRTKSPSESTLFPDPHQMATLGHLTLLQA